jgi:protein SCO1/2
MTDLATTTAATHGVPRRRLSGRRVLLGMLLVLLVAVIPGIVVPTLLCRPPDPVLPDLGEVTPFAFTDETGAPFTAASMRGHVTIVSFLFTRCDSICPATTLKMQHIQDKTFDQAGKIQLLSFSVDPTYDTPPVLAAYARHYQADDARWRFVTGPLEEMRTLVEGPLMTSMLKTGMTPKGAPDIAHGGHFLLVDGHLHIRGVYDSAEITRLETMMKDARYLARKGI